MNTNINYTVENELTMDKFANVCTFAHKAMELLEQTEAIYNFLLAHKGVEFSPKEIGLALGKPFTWQCWNDPHKVLVKRISDSLYWLYNLGLINRSTYTKQITIKLNYEQEVKDVKIINGVEYVGYIHKDTQDVISTSYKWFVS